jgi:hypothetical protein
MSELENLAERAAADALDRPPDLVGNNEPIYSVGVDGAGNYEHRVSSSHVLTHALGISIDRQTSDQAKCVSRMMQSLGWKKLKTTIRVEGRTTRGYTHSLEPWE